MSLLSTDLLLLHLPEQIQTERLLLRTPKPGDGPVMSEAINESVNELCPWLEWACGGQTEEESERYIRNNMANFIQRNDFSFMLIEKSSGVFVGNVGLHTRDRALPSFEMGYWLRTAHAGHGYMTEAANALTTFAFDHLHAVRIEIRCDVLNISSAAVAERAGYTLEGHFKKHRRNLKGELCDTLIYAKVRP